MYFEIFIFSKYFRLYQFDVLCDMNILEEKLKLNSDFSCLSHNTFHVVGKCNDKLEYMVHRVYICSDLKSSIFVPQSDHLEDCISNINIMSSFSNYTCTSPNSS